MNGKLTILLLLAAAAQNSFARNISDSCVAATSIQTDLATIDYGQEIALDALGKMAKTFHDEIMYVLTSRRRSSRNYIRSENDDERFQLAKEEALYQLLRGMAPTIEAIRVFRSELDSAAVLTQRTAIAEEYIGGIFAAINATRAATNYTASQAEVAEYVAASTATGSTMIQGLFDSLLDGTTQVPDAAQAVIACIEAKAEYYILAAIKSIGVQINIMLDAIFNIGARNARARIAAAYEETRSSYNAEVLYKYTAIRNIAVAMYLQNGTDTITGLYDVQSTVPAVISI